MLVEYDKDKKKNESYANWVFRKQNTEHFCLTIRCICNVLRVSRNWVHVKFRNSCKYIKFRGIVFYQIESVENWLLKHSTYTMQTRVLNLYDYCTSEALYNAEHSTDTRHHTYSVKDINGRIKSKHIVGYMPEKLLKALSLPSCNVLYYNRPALKEVKIKPFRYLFKKKIFPKDAGTILADFSHKFHEQFYREAFMFGYCKIMIDKSKTLWVPIKAPLGPYMQWTIPAVVTEINKVPLNLPVFSDFQDDLLLYNQIMPKQLVNTKNMKK